MQGCLLVDSHKSTGSGPVRSPVSCPSKKTKNHKTKTKKPSKQNTQPQPNQKNKTQRSGIATSYENNMHDDILCHCENGYRKRSKTKKTQNHTKGPGKRVIEATKLNAETRDPPSQDPRSSQVETRRPRCTQRKLGNGCLLTWLWQKLNLKK